MGLLGPRISVFVILINIVNFPPLTFITLHPYRQVLWVLFFAKALPTKYVFQLLDFCQSDKLKSIS